MPLTPHQKFSRKQRLKYNKQVTPIQDKEAEIKILYEEKEVETSHDESVTEISQEEPIVKTHRSKRKKKSKKQQNQEKGYIGSCNTFSTSVPNKLKQDTSKEVSESKSKDDSWLEAPDDRELQLQLQASLEKSSVPDNWEQHIV